MPTTEQQFCTADGTSTNADDPERMIWDGMCSFWTDDWSLVGVAGDGTPVCHNCSAPGHQTAAKNWDEGVAKFEAEGNEGYTDFVNSLKNVCNGRQGASELWAKWKAEREQE